MIEYKIKLSAAAIKDIEDTAKYIYYELKVPEYSIRFRKIIYKKIQSLSTMPNRCKTIYMTRPRGFEIKSLYVRRYDIIFTVDEDNREVNIIRVLYHGRDIDELI